MIETHPLGNFTPKRMHYLLLGSFAAKGMDSDPNYDWYYGSKYNQFWHIIEKVYSTKLPDKDSKKKLFSDLNFGIADIIYQCERSKGSSLDVNLTNIVYNNSLRQVIKNNKLRKIFFSSRFVEKHFKRHFKDIVQDHSEIEFTTLPSPSPRYAQMTKDEKIARYKILLPELANQNNY